MSLQNGLNPEDLYGMTVSNRLPDHEERGEKKCESFVSPEGLFICAGCEKTISDEDEVITMSPDPYAPPFCEECAKEYHEEIDIQSEAMHALEYVKCLDCEKVPSALAFSGTTEIFVSEKPGELLEVRCGFAVMGHTNMDEKGYKRARKNPFHPQFHDNYATGKGETLNEALTAMKASVQGMSESFFNS